MYRVSQKLKAFLDTPIPRELWHYTSVDALKGILSSGKFWATEARFTNDRTEYVFARQVAIDYLNSVKPTGGFARLGVKFLLKLLDISYETGVVSPDFADVFIASFSEAADFKSQWMEYGSAYKGVSIAFDLRHLRPASDLDTAISLAPCLYEKEKQEELIREALERFMEPIKVLWAEDDNNYAIKRIWPTIQRIWPNAGGPPYVRRTDSEILEFLRRATNEMNKDLFVLTSHCKHPKFCEEHEWRLVLPRGKKKDSPKLPIRYREACWSGQPIKIPYIEMDLEIADSDRLPMVRVMTGPRCDVTAVKDLLEHCRYDIPVTPSQVPVR